MGILDYIRTRLSGSKRGAVILDSTVSGGFAALGIKVSDFASLVWLNVCDLICDLIENVKVTEDPNLSEEGLKRFLAFRSLLYAEGHLIWQRVLDFGFVVIGTKEEEEVSENGKKRLISVRYWVMKETEYNIVNGGDGTMYAKPLAEGIGCEVMRSTTYALRQLSDLALCRPWLRYLDSVMSASDTCVRRLGAVVIASPKNLANSPTSYVLTSSEKEAIEKQVQEEYGTLRSQKSVMVLPREMSWQVVSLSNLDTKLNEKTRLAILAICDRVKVPANQVAIIDANSGKTLSNGSELREGDKMKYKTARRLFEATFVQLANDLGIKFTYIIEGEPDEDTNVKQIETE